MQLIFTKGFGKHDRMQLIRGGAVEESIECPKQGIIPHDMVHYAVEHTLQKRGFIGRVFGGETASFEPPRVSWRLFGLSQASAVAA